MCAWVLLRSQRDKTPDTKVCFSRATSSPSCWCCGEERPIKHSSVDSLRFSSAPPVFALLSMEKIPPNQTMCLIACLCEAKTTRRIIHGRGRENLLLQGHLKTCWFCCCEDRHNASDTKKGPRVEVMQALGDANLPIETKPTTDTFSFPTSAATRSRLPTKSRYDLI